MGLSGVFTFPTTKRIKSVKAKVGNDGTDQFCGDLLLLSESSGRPLAKKIAKLRALFSWRSV